MDSLPQEIGGIKLESIDFYEARTVKWNDDSESVTMIDQTLLPTKFELIDCKTVLEVIEAIKTMRIRGAPAIGVAGAMGVALSVLFSNASTKKGLLEEIASDAEAIRNARPTAVNLAWGVDQVLDFIKKKLPDSVDEESKSKVVEFVKRLADEDVRTNKKLSDMGAELFQSNESVLTHCK